MEILEQITIGIDDIFSLVKIFYLVAMMIYLVFAGIVIRQVQMMVEAIGGVLRGPLRLMAWLHFGVALIVFGLALVWL